MMEQVTRLVSLAETARLRSAELSHLLEMIKEMEVDREDPDNCPDYVNSCNLGAVRSAAVLLAELVNGMNEDLAGGLEFLARQQVEGATAKQQKRGGK